MGQILALKKKRHFWRGLGWMMTVMSTTDILGTSHYCFCPCEPCRLPAEAGSWPTLKIQLQSQTTALYFSITHANPSHHGADWGLQRKFPGITERPGSPPTLTNLSVGSHFKVKRNSKLTILSSFMGVTLCMIHQCVWFFVCFCNLSCLYILADITAKIILTNSQIASKSSN